MNMNVTVNLGQMMEQEFQKELEARMFPGCELSSYWLGMALDALMLASPLSLGISPDHFAKLTELSSCMTASINLYDFALLSNNLEARTPRDLGMTLSKYGVFIKEVGKLSKRWNEITKDLRAEVEQRVKEDFVRKNAAEKGAAAGNILSPIKAEA